MGCILRGCKGLRKVVRCAWLEIGDGMDLCGGDGVCGGAGGRGLVITV